MPKAPSPRSRGRSKGRSKSKPFWLDRLVAALFVFFSALLLAFGVAAMVSPSIDHELRKTVGKVAASMVGPFFVAIAGLNLIAFVGMFRGLRRAFFLVAALQILVIIQSHDFAPKHLALSHDVWMTIYVSLRLIPAFGPKLK